MSFFSYKITALEHNIIGIICLSNHLAGDFLRFLKKYL